MDHPQEEPLITPTYGTFTADAESPEPTPSTSEQGPETSPKTGPITDRTRLVIDRGILTTRDLDSWAIKDLKTKNTKLADSSNNQSLRDRCCPSNKNCCCTSKCCASWIMGFLPVLTWIPKYKVSKNLLADVVAGFTVAIMQVPQGMAYAMLASVPPVVGLYTSFFPALVYFFFGSSRHGSIGTFALISMLTNTAMEDVLGDMRSTFPSPAYLNSDNHTTNNSSNVHKFHILPEMSPDLDTVEVAVVVAFLVGIIEIGMGLARMGSLTVLMSDQMISGLITGTAIQVLTSQLKSMTGANITKYSGAFNTVLTWLSFMEKVNTINWGIVLVTLTSLAFLMLVKYLIDPCFKKKFKVPFPAELLLVIIGTVLSHHFHFKESYNIEIIGPIPTGLVSPKMPHLQLIPKLLTGGAMVSIIGVSLSLSIVMSYGKKHNYAIDSNQELLAYGLANTISSFFSCIPCSISLSRSAVLESSGGKSQFSMLVSCAFLLVVILVLGPLFSALPDAVLSTIIVVALRSMFAGVQDLAISWRTSKSEALVWLVTFLGVILLDIDYGLGIGVIVSLATVLYHAHRPSSTNVLGHLEGTELYVDLVKYHGSVREVKGVKIIAFPGPLYFGNRDLFRTHILELCDFSGESKLENLTLDDLSGSCNVKLGESQLLLYKFKPSAVLHHVVLDCSAISFIDSGGVESLVQLAKDMRKKGAYLFLAAMQDCAIRMIETCGIPAGLTKAHMFPSVHDAVLVARQDYGQLDDEVVTSEYVCL